MQKFLTTAPVVAAIWFTLTAGITIEIFRFFPDLILRPL
jgi:photosystem I subunit 9